MLKYTELKDCGELKAKASPGLLDDMSSLSVSISPDVVNRVIKRLESSNQWVGEQYGVE